jgi:phosphoglycolate phosphatase
LLSRLSLTEPDLPSSAVPFRKELEDITYYSINFTQNKRKNSVLLYRQSFFGKVYSVAIKGIIFDLDGTLVDTLEDLTDSMNYALNQLGLPMHSPEICQKMVGNGLGKFAERALGNENLKYRDILLDTMTSHYWANCVVKTRPYSGLLSVIMSLKKKGIYLAVLTNKNQEPAEKIVNFFFGSGVFNPIMGYKPERKVKPDPEGIFDILNRWSLPCTQVVMIGDSEVDIETALAAKVCSVGTSWGFRSREELVGAGADKIIDNPSQILDLLA